jgi:cephalosporin-C deacetylase
MDMPLEQLKKYQGRNPRPDDLQAYWERGLEEMRALDPEVEMRPAGFRVPGAECFDLFFTGVGGARIHAKYVRPTVKAKAKPHPAVVQFHGYAGHAGDWADKLSWVSLGYSIASMDCRGQGGASQDPGGVHGTTLRGHIIRGLQDGPEHLLFRRIFLDCAQLAGIVMNMSEVDPARVGALGGSQGGGLTLACASLEPRIKRVAPTFPFLCDFKRVWEMDLAKDAYEEIRTYFRHFDPQHVREDETWMSLGYIDVQHLVERIRGEVLMGVGLMDTICPPSTQFAAFNRITTPKHLEIYPDFGHEGLPGFADTVMQFMLGL